MVPAAGMVTALLVRKASPPSVATRELRGIVVPAAPPIVPVTVDRVASSGSTSSKEALSRNAKPSDLAMLNELPTATTPSSTCSRRRAMPEISWPCGVSSSRTGHCPRRRERLAPTGQHIASKWSARCRWPLLMPCNQFDSGQSGWMYSPRQALAREYAEVEIRQDTLMD